MNSELNVATWNVWGLGDPHRALILQNWMRRFYPATEVICLQELQANPSTVNFHLQSLLPGGTVQLDVTPEGRTGCAIVVAPHLTVLAQGSKGDGTFAWVKVQTEQGTLNIGSVYAPAERGRRLAYWRWLCQLSVEDNWLLAGDFSMAEFQDDSLGVSTVLHGTEARLWHRVVDNLDLLDLYLCASYRHGPIFTW
jgi:exonuclease III